VTDVLVIDSDEASFGALVPALQEAGHSVRVARTGAGGLVGSRTQRPDLVLLEALLPDISGLEVCRSLKNDEATREACVIFLSTKNRRGARSPLDTKTWRAYRCAAAMWLW